MKRLAGLCRLSALVLALMLAASPATAQEDGTTETAPASCAIGAFVMDLYDLSPATSTFDSDIWLWSLCPDTGLEPLTSMEYINASEVDADLADANLVDGTVWSSRKLSGSWRHYWDLRSFPFDQHTLTMTLEEGLEDTSAIVYSADDGDSGYAAGLRIPGWRITGFRLVPSDVTYATTFGDPDLADGTGSTFSRLNVEIDIARDGLLNFLKMTAVIYIAALLALLSFLFNVKTTGVFNARMSVLAGALFATVLNLPRAGSELGNNPAPTLIDALHIICMVLILTVAVLSVQTNHRFLAGEDHDAILRREHRNVLICAALFAAANVALIWSAVASG